MLIILLRGELMNTQPFRKEFLFREREGEKRVERESLLVYLKQACIHTNNEIKQTVCTDQSMKENEQKQQPANIM